jgi:hypothetical protein
LPLVVISVTEDLLREFQLGNKHIQYIIEYSSMEQNIRELVEPLQGQMTGTTVELVDR